MSVCFHNLYLYCPLVASFRHNDWVSFTNQLAYKTPGLYWGYCSSNTYRTLSYFKNCYTRMLFLRSALMHCHLVNFLVVFVLRMIFWSVSAAAIFRIRCRMSSPWRLWRLQKYQDCALGCGNFPGGSEKYNPGQLSEDVRWRVWVENSRHGLNSSHSV